MNEKDMREALLRGEGTIDLQALTHRVLRRDRHRVWLLGFACVAAWMLVVMLPWSTILPMVAEVARQQAELDPDAAPAVGAQRAQSLLVYQVVRQGTIATFVCSVASMFVAAVCTVSLIILSRRATLRQVNARLLQISAQLKTLAMEPR